MLEEWTVRAPATVKAGKVRFTIDNIGTAPHELLAFRSDLAPADYPKAKDGDIIEDDPSITQVTDGPNLDPGTKQSRVIDLSVPGTYIFVCNIPGHFTLGMYTVVTVSP